MPHNTAGTKSMHAHVCLHLYIMMQVPRGPWHDAGNSVWQGGSCLHLALKHQHQYWSCLVLVFSFSPAALLWSHITAQIQFLVQALLKKAGKPSVLGSLEENDPDAADDDEEDEVEADGAQEDAQNSSIVDKITDLLGKTGLTSK